MTEDEKQFGENVWVYCCQHMRPHVTGWCTVHVRDKAPLKATNATDAATECRANGFKLYGDSAKG